MRPLHDALKMADALIELRPITPGEAAAETLAAAVRRLARWLDIERERRIDAEGRLQYCRESLVLARDKSECYQAERAAWEVTNIVEARADRYAEALCLVIHTASPYISNDPDDPIVIMHDIALQAMKEGE